MILQICTLLGALGLLLYGMYMMSSGLQKISGDKLRTIFLPWMTSNPIKRVLSGLGITAIIQSSRATTVMVISFVNAGLLTLAQATGVIMGANIGTTVTTWIVALLGFNINLNHLIFPLIAIGFICSMFKKSRIKEISELIIGFSLLFLGLLYMKSAIPALSSYPQDLPWLSKWACNGFLSVLLSVILGIVITFIIQSSSASISLAMIIVYLGWIPFEMGAGFVLGANIGTTITGNIAASVGNKNAKRAALIHSLFNIIGVVAWALIFFHPFLHLIGKIITIFGLPDPSRLAFGTTAISMADGFAAVCGIAMVHTMFNLINACILIWFSHIIVKFVCWFIKEPEKAKDEQNFALKYISSGRLGTPSLSLDQALNEIINFASNAHDGFSYVKQAVNETDPDKFEIYRTKLVECEEITDKFEYEIAAFLNGITSQELSAEEGEEVKVMYRVIGELESLGDSCENISRLLARLRAHKQEFDEDAIANLNLMIGKVEAAFQVMETNLNQAKDGKLVNIDNAYNAENNINNLRNALREEGIQQIEKQEGHYQASNYFLDLVAELEAMGDFIINISQAVVRNNEE